MAKIKFKRGISNTFYFVEKDTSNGSGHVLKELRVLTNQSFQWTINKGFSFAPRSVIALTIDPEERLIEHSSQVTNSLFIIDDTLILKRIEQSEEDIFEVKMMIDLNKVYPAHMMGKLRDMRRQDFKEISISEDCITIDQSTVNLNSKTFWNFRMEQQIKYWDWEVLSTESLDLIDKQLMILKRKKVLKPDQSAWWKETDEEAEQGFLVKPFPGGRKLGLIGEKVSGRIEMIEFISNNLLLVKFTTYWTMIDINGQVLEIPEDLKLALNKCYFTSMRTKNIYKKNSIMLMLQGKDMTTSILFNHRGQVSELCEYKHLNKIEAGLLELSPHVLCDDQG